MSDFRPKYLDQIIGNSDVLHCIKISIVSAKQRNKVLPHILLKGGSGLGKTTIGIAIANELGVDYQIANASTINSVKHIKPYFARIKENSLIILDEAHALSQKTEECLYPVMEDFRLDIGTETEPLSVKLPPFTLICATTEAGKLSEPFRNRFKYQYNLKYYTQKELEQIVYINCQKIQININNYAISEIARRSKGIPRQANAYVEWIRDYMVAHSLDYIGNSEVNQAFKLQKIDERGLTEEDRLYLTKLKKHQPCGLRTMSSLTGLSENVISNDMEPLLLRMGLIKKTSKGRVVCEN